jgi:hypothetical protein
MANQSKKDKIVPKKDLPKNLVTITIGMEIMKVLTVSYALNPREDLGGKNGHIEIAMSYLPNVAEKMLEVDMLIQVHATEQTDEELPLLQIRTLNHFLLRGIESLTDEGNMAIPVVMMQRISEIAYDTARGLILVRNAGTTYPDFVLPILKKDYVQPTHILEGENGAPDLPVYMVTLKNEVEGVDALLKRKRAKAKQRKEQAA